MRTVREEESHARPRVSMDTACMYATLKSVEFADMLSSLLWDFALVLCFTANSGKPKMNVRFSPPSSRINAHVSLRVAFAIGLHHATTRRLLSSGLCRVSSVCRSSRKQPYYPLGPQRQHCSAGLIQDRKWRESNNCVTFTSIERRLQVPGDR